MAVGPFARIIAQVMVVGASVFSRAFMQAYQQALQNAKKGGAQAAAQATVRRVKMGEAEALAVLNIERSQVQPALLEERFQHLYELNDPQKGGSFYLQSKVFRAKEALERITKQYEKSQGDKEEAQAKGD